MSYLTPLPIPLDRVPIFNEEALKACLERSLAGVDNPERLVTLAKSIGLGVFLIYSTDIGLLKKQNILYDKSIFATKRAVQTALCYGRNSHQEALKTIDKALGERYQFVNGRLVVLPTNSPCKILDRSFSVAGNLLSNGGEWYEPNKRTRTFRIDIRADPYPSIRQLETFLRNELDASPLRGSPRGRVRH